MKRLLLLVSASLLSPTLHAGEVTVDAGRGPVAVLVPTGYDPGTPAPLLLMLHGYTSSGAETEAILQLAPQADLRGMLYAFPDGTTDIIGNRFWNATDACCDLFGSGVDDVGYLLALIEAIQGQLAVDPEQIYIAGHSNGGFMAYRMACDHATVVDKVVSFAGATYDDPADCAPARPVHTLQIHGTADGTIAYGGGFTIASYPGAVETTETWATYNGCQAVATPGPDLDLDLDLPGAETSVLRYATGCTDGGSASLWTIDGGAHVPNLTPDFTRLVANFLLASDIFSDGFETGDVSAWDQTLP